MALDYSKFEWGPEPISADSDTIDAHIISGAVVPQAPSTHDLRNAVEWLALYQVEKEFIDQAQSFANVIAFLELTAQSREYRSALAKAKKAYAKEHGIPVSKVRVKG